MTKVYVVVCKNLATKFKFVEAVFTNKKLAENYVKWSNKNETNYISWVEDHKIEKFDYSIGG